MELKSFPILMGTTLNLSENDEFVDQKWVTCGSCGCLQLANLIPLEKLYSEQHSAGAVGKIWQEHHKAFSDFILEDKPSNICEIGAAHGELAKNLLRAKPDLDYLIIEPSPVNIHKNVRVILGFAEDHLNEVYNYQNIVHSHVLEHLYSPTKFLSNLAVGMKEQSFMYMSIPNIQRLIETGGTNSLNFEHTYYLHPKQLQSLLQKLELQIEREFKYLDHSYFFKIKKSRSSNGIDDKEIANIAEFAEQFRDMWKDLGEFTSIVNAQISKESIPTYIFGAHVFSQGLISLGLDTKQIIGILDNSQEKQGKRLYGSNLEVFDPKVIQGDLPVRVILKASHYQDEIRKQLQALNSNVQVME
jgi:2-polyprenyl-3-methyl-5-hydroxy-6-metoxy-1,4-benzoquinol methylase